MPSPIPGYPPDASATVRGLVNTSSGQVFAGLKEFQGGAQFDTFADFASDPSAPISSSGHVRLRSNAGVLEASQDGAAYAALGGITGSGTAGKLTYWTGSGAVGAASGLYWDGSNLGVGNPSPAYTLDVGGYVKTDTGFIADATDAAGYVGYFLQLQDTTGTQCLLMAGAGDGSLAATFSSSVVASGTNAAFKFGTVNTLTTGQSAARFYNDGFGTLLWDLGLTGLTFPDGTTQSTAFTGSAGISQLTGDVTAGPGSGSVAATVAAVGGSSASTIHTAELLANAATDANTASTIVKRDGSGNFSAGTITANLTGNASGSAGSFTGSLVGDVTGTQGATVVSSVGGSTAAAVHTSQLLTAAATALSTASTLALRDSSGNAQFNNSVQGYTTTATAGTTTTLTVASTQLQFFTGSTTQTVKLPDATTIATGVSYTVVNLSSGVVAVQDNGAGALCTIQGSANSAVTFTCTNIGSAAGTWSIATQEGMDSSGNVSFGGSTMSLRSTSSNIVKSYTANTGSNVGLTWDTNVTLSGSTKPYQWKNGGALRLQLDLAEFSVWGTANTGDGITRSQFAAVENGTAYNASPETGYSFYVNTDSVPNFTHIGALQMGKSNSTSGNLDSFMRAIVRANSGGFLEAWRANASGHFLIGSASDSGNGEILQVTGTAVVSTAAKIGTTLLVGGTGTIPQGTAWIQAASSGGVGGALWVANSASIAVGSIARVAWGADGTTDATPNAVLDNIVTNASTFTADLVLKLYDGSALNEKFRWVANAAGDYYAQEGSKHGFNGSALTSYIQGDSTTHGLIYKSNVSTGSSHVAHILDTSNDLTTSGDLLLSVRRNGTEKLSINKDGVLVVAAGTQGITCSAVTAALFQPSSGTATIRGVATSNGSGIGVTLDNSGPLSASGDKQVNLSSGQFIYGYIDYAGELRLRFQGNEFRGYSLSTPSGTSGASGGASGSLSSSTTYYYRVSAIEGDVDTQTVYGETIACAEFTATTGASAHSAIIGWGVVQGAAGYRVYGRTTGAELLIATIWGQMIRSYTDDGSITPSGALPGVANTGKMAFRADVADASDAIAYIWNTKNALANATAQLTSWRNNAVEKRGMHRSGKFLSPTGTADAYTGVATLSGGTITVSTTAVTASSQIRLWHGGSGTSANFGFLSPGTITAGTSFVINSTNASDNDTVIWELLN